MERLDKNKLEHAREFARCANGYEGWLYWVERYWHIPDHRKGRYALYRPYECQKQIAKDWFDKVWRAELKARQLGVTTTYVSLVGWACTFRQFFKCSVMAQGLEYAKEFIGKVKDGIERLPPWMRPETTADSSSGSQPRVEYDASGWGCEVRSMAATEKSGRSMAGSFLLFDEAAYFDGANLNAALRAAVPTLETADGHACVVSTSRGPIGDFYELWQQAAGGQNKFKAVFYPWQCHPDRTQDWYNQTAAENSADANFMRYEYPSTPEEAWESTQGRCLPFFRRDKHEIETKELLRRVHAKEVLPEWNCYRGIDWGGVDPFVCLFVFVIPGHAGFSVDPKCKEAVRELISWSWRKDAVNEAEDRDNHVPDALRYIVQSTPVPGHLHVYDCIYEPGSASRGIDKLDLCKRVKQKSEGVNFRATYADPSRPDDILLFSRHGVACVPGRRSAGTKCSSILHGIDLLNVLMQAKNDLHKPLVVTEADEIRKMRYDIAVVGGTVKMRDRMRMQWYDISSKDGAAGHEIMGTDF